MIQRLFNIYPRRAVREVLEDRSPSYNGTVQAADEYFKRTYNRLRSSPQQCQSARELYDTCGLSQPSEDQMNFYNRAPTQQELDAKLRRAANTSAGVDGLEYRHLRAIDPICILLQTVCKMVWKLGIPNCWKISQTVPILYSFFLPTSLMMLTSGPTPERCDLPSERSPASPTEMILYAETGSNLWILAYQASKRLGVRIDVSGDENLRIVADEVSVSPFKAVRGLRKVARQRHTRNLLTDKSHQGVVTNCLSLEGTSKDMARLVSCRAPLSFHD
ncbi:hypothetical protein OUZ56_003504 [Daphnia magna]|uniref:Uncharacterized protein n=1 Tax=Daphnia magna TaxID=35525 RepID=A0ABR0A913_9CRUS|nr:hypothetical protein OUZ56_003504 [Daphnia magna]